MSEFEKKGCIQTIMFWITLHHENNKIYNFCAPSQSMILKQEFRDASDWKKVLQLVIIWNRQLKLCRSLKLNAFGKSRFELLYTMRTSFLQVSCFFKKKAVKLEILRHKRLGEKNFPMRQILNWNSYRCQKLKKTFAFLKLRYD